MSSHDDSMASIRGVSIFVMLLSRRLGLFAAKDAPESGASFALQLRGSDYAPLFIYCLLLRWSYNSNRTDGKTIVKILLTKGFAIRIFIREIKIIHGIPIIPPCR